MIVFVLLALGALAVMLAACSSSKTGAQPLPEVTFTLSATDDPSRDPSLGPEVVWGPGLGRIAFVRDGHVWTVKPDGSELVRLTASSREDRWPVWSPDRGTIAFVRMPREWGGTPSICTVASDGGPSHVLKYADDIGAPDYRFINGLAYSPDGGILAFSDHYSVGDEPERNRLVLIDLRTRTTTPLIDRAGGFLNAIDAGWPLSWSPYGKTMLVSQGGMDSEGGVTFLFDVTSRHLRQLPIADASHSDWSPNGSIVISTATQEKTRILIATQAGVVKRTLLRGLGWQATDAQPAYDDAHFSSSGRRIVYTVRGRRTSTLWIMRADGSDQHRLTRGEQPAWR